MAWNIESNSNKLIPWQNNLNSSLKKLDPKITIETNTEEGKQIIEAPSLNAKEANIFLKNAIKIASNTAGFDPPPSSLSLNEKNWVIGVEQTLDLKIDLRTIPKIPGLKIGILIDSSSKKGIQKGYPLQTTISNQQIKWPLKLGSTNSISFHKWQWSRIGIGIILILLIMSLSLLLQYLRLEMGFGFPQLPLIFLFQFFLKIRE